MTRLLAVVFFILMGFLLKGCESGYQEQEDAEWALALHGGAGDIPEDLPEDVRDDYLEALEATLAIGEEILIDGGSAVEAVEYVVRSLEDNPLFNAGRGSVFTREGTHQLDAAIMDGSTLDAGAVTGLTTVKNPVTLARLVMETSDHIFFSGEGAERFADSTDIERVENDWFSTERRHDQWLQFQQKEDSSTQQDNQTGQSGFGTVGAVALDRNGHLASATSTGGMTNKMYGRIGDVPIIGSGTYANSLVAISATGSGEEIMRHVSARTIASYMEFTESSLDEALDFMLDERLEAGDAGFIAVDIHGNISMKMNTESMFRAGGNSVEFRQVAIWEDDEENE